MFWLPFIGNSFVVHIHSLHSQHVYILLKDVMRGNLFVKSILIMVLGLMLLAATGMILGVIDDRERYQRSAIYDIANSLSGEQQVLAPVLVIPYKAYVNRYEPDSRRTVREVQERHYYVLPQTLDVKAQMSVTSRKLGIYQAQLYTGPLHLSGSFGKVDVQEIENLSGFDSLGQPYFVVSISDPRGIVDVPSFILDGESLDLKEGVSTSQLDKGMHIPVSFEALSASDESRFDLTFTLQGTQKLSVVPVGRQSTMALSSDWPHPNFLGNTLPKEHDISEQGFSAQWQSSWFATNINDSFGNATVPNLRYNDLPAFSVTMIETVDQYQLNERSVKYAVLFISLTFIGFLIFEFMTKVSIHPVQYTMVGASLVMFYMLLLALSEHIGFNLAYLVATLASCGVIGVYLCSVLKSVTRGLSFTGGLLGLYALLFLIMQLEEMALLLGTLLLFVILALLMLLTRKVDWYQNTSLSNGSDTKKQGLRAMGFLKKQLDTQNVSNENNTTKT